MFHCMFYFTCDRSFREAADTLRAGFAVLRPLGNSLLQRSSHSLIKETGVPVQKGQTDAAMYRGTERINVIKMELCWATSGKNLHYSLKCLAV